MNALSHPHSPIAQGPSPQTEGVGLMQRMAEYLLIAAAFFSSLYNYGSFIEGLLAVGDALYLLAFFCCLMGGLRGVRIFSEPAVVLMMFAAGILMMSGMVTYSLGTPEGASLQSVKIAFCMVVIPLIIATVAGVSGLPLIEKFLLAWLAGGFLSAASATISSFGIAIPGLYDEVAAAGGRVRGLAYHSNVLGYSVALVVPIAFYFWIKASRPLVRIGLLFAMLPLFYATYASGSRTSLLALAIGSLPLILRRNTWIPLVLMTIAGGIIALLYIILILQSDVQTGSSLAESAVGRLLGLAESAGVSDEGRMYFITSSLAEFETSPIFGIGYAGIRFAHVHALAILKAGGLFAFLGLIIWLVAIFICERQVASLQREESSLAGGRLLLNLVRCGILIWIISGAFQPLLTDRNGYLAIGILLAMKILASRDGVGSRA